MTPTMRKVTEQAVEPIDISGYVDAVPAADLNDYEICRGLVECVYRSSDDRFDHIMVMTKSKNVYLVVIIDLHHRAIHGHHLLDLNKLYGL